jgi:excinuclease ABC subunit C
MENKIKKLLDKPGVYYFLDKNKKIIYIGKATSLKNRVKSYFQGQKTQRPIEEMINQVKDIKCKKTESVPEAIILESLEIKKHKPKYNVIGKDDKSWNYIALTKNDFPQVATVRLHDINNMSEKDKKNKYLKLFGPFPQLKTKETLKILRKLFHYSTCNPNSKKPCFYYQLKQCSGVCTNEISKGEYKKRVINPLTLFLNGKKKQVLTELTKQMKSLAKNNFFEEAAILRNQINNLKHIHDVSLLDSWIMKHKTWGKKQKIKIEGYDISNLGSSNMVGSMVVFDHNGPIKAEYKKFKIKSLNKQSDVDALEEIISRRLNHDEWKMPDYFLVDGGKPQLNKIKKLFSKQKIDIPIIGIAKGKDRKKNEFHLSNRTKELTDFVKNNKKLLIQVRDEAHRFAIEYQRKRNALRIKNSY